MLLCRGARLQVAVRDAGAPGRCWKFPGAGQVRRSPACALHNQPGAAFALGGSANPGPASAPPHAEGRGDARVWFPARRTSPDYSPCRDTGLAAGAWPCGIRPPSGRSHPPWMPRGSGGLDRAGAAEQMLFPAGRRFYLRSPAGRAQLKADSPAVAAQKLAAGAVETSSAPKCEPPGGVPSPEQSQDGRISKTQQLRKVFKEYGAVGVTFHVGISLVSLGMFYLAISSGIDMAAVLFKLGFSEAVVQSKMAAGTSTFVLAYAVHKLFAPVRISVTLVSVPFVVRYFRKTGLFKPPASSP
ncbi:protein FAM210B, mitochondrial [Lepisosteus oculatus]|uniref:protein FAM210B, mitochondrial n=1 Tax=Lepisosteus oculatus TaxID=7918 RepID=UPI0035F50883